MLYEGLKEIQLTNFKSFSNTASFPIKPITLIFGPNSSGKSSFIQSLLMLKQSTSYHKNRQLNTFGPYINLGGFKNFVFEHDIKNELSLSFSLSTAVGKDPNIPDTEKSAFYRFFLKQIRKGSEIPEQLRLLLKVIEQFNEIRFSMTFYSDENGTKTLLKNMAIFLGENEKPLFVYAFSEDNVVLIRTGDPDGKHHINFEHPFWEEYWRVSLKEDNKKLIDDVKDIFDNPEIIEDFNDFELFEKIRSEEFENSELSEYDFFKADIEKIKNDFLFAENNLKGFEQALQLLKIIHKYDFYLHYFNIKGFKINGFSLTESINWNQDKKIFGRPEILFITITQMIANYVNDISYLGPLRQIPSNHYLYKDDTDYMDTKGGNMPDILYKDKELLKKINSDLDLLDQDYLLKVVKHTSDQVDTDDLYSLQLVNKKTGVWSRFTDVGFGFSQLLPIVTLLNVSKGKTIVIEQPELHLHPSMQAEMADLIINGVKQETFKDRLLKELGKYLFEDPTAYKGYSKNKNSVIIETHSEHLILRILRRIRETTNKQNRTRPQISPDDVSVIYIQPGKSGSRVIHIPITEDGDFSCDWPDGFFEERDKELFF